MQKKQPISSHGLAPRKYTRGQFITGAGAAALSFTIMRPELVRGSLANSKIDLGVIGCGGRGTWITDLFDKHGGYNIVAAADYFQDRVDPFAEKFKIKRSRKYTGLSCYKRLLEGKLDAVAIESPPYFHPEQAAAAVEAGLHVYLAKPVAVDVPGCLTVAESAQKATAKQRVFLVDFQTRANALYREAIKRVQYGDIGKILSGEATYHDGSVAPHDLSGTPEAHLRNWLSYIDLSGDIIVEQNVHALDVATWIMDAHPISAYGTGGPNPMTDEPGDYWGHYSVIYQFPNDVVVSFNSKRYGKGWGSILCRMYGTQGTIDTHYFGNVTIRGNTPYKGGSTGNLYNDGAVSNITDFHENVTKERFANTTTPPSVRSTLTGILGRTAGKRQAAVTWDELLAAKEVLPVDLKGLKT